MPKKINNFDQYLKNNWRSLYRAAYIWTHDNEQASNLTRLTIIKCLKNKQQFDNDQQLKIFLFKIMSDICQHYRHQTIFKVSLLKKHIADNRYINDIENEQLRSPLIVNIKSSFKALKLEHREVLTLAIHQNMNYQEISQVLDVPIGTVISRISHARSQLKQSMESSHKKQKSNVWPIK